MGSGVGVSARLCACRGSGGGDVCGDGHRPCTLGACGEEGVRCVRVRVRVRVCVRAREAEVGRGPTTHTHTHRGTHTCMPHVCARARSHGRLHSHSTTPCHGSTLCTPEGPATSPHLVWHGPGTRLGRTWTHQCVCVCVCVCVQVHVYTIYVFVCV